MAETTYRPGDIAMVKGQYHHSNGAPAAYVHAADAECSPRWVWIDDKWTSARAEVGPVLGNVADIAAVQGVEDHQQAIADAFLRRMTWPSMHWTTQHMDPECARALAKVITDSGFLSPSQGEQARREGRIGALREVEHNLEDPASIDLVRELLAREGASNG